MTWKRITTRDLYEALGVVSEVFPEAQPHFAGTAFGRETFAIGALQIEVDVVGATYPIPFQISIGIHPTRREMREEGKSPTVKITSGDEVFFVVVPIGPKNNLIRPIEDLAQLRALLLELRERFANEGTRKIN